MEAEKEAAGLSARLNRIHYIGKGLQLAWRAARGWTVLWLGLTLLRGFAPAAMVLLTKYLVDGIAAVIGAGVSWQSVEPVLVPAALMGALLVLQQVLDGLLGWVRTAQAELVEDYVKHLIHEQAASVDLAFFDSPEQQDFMIRANSEASRRSLSILENMGSMLASTATLVGVAALLVAYSWWLPLVLVVSTLPALGIVMHHHRLHHDWWKKTTVERRWYEYHDRVLTFAQTAAELRLLDLKGYFQQRYQDRRATLRRGRLRLLRRQNISQLWAGVLALAVSSAAIVWVMLRALRGLASIGDLALFYQAFNQGQGLMRTLLNSVGQLYADALFLEHLFAFLSIKPEVHDPAEPVDVEVKLRQGIEVRDVRFHYPGSEQLALEDFSITIPARKIVAIVGPNGAGKSTLIKLLCRFYDPVEGAVTIDGVDIRRIPFETLRRFYTVMLQDPVRYAESVAENIAFGDIREGVQMQEVIAAARESGAHESVEKLPYGYDTLLDKLFPGGTILSGGQMQRVALARAMYRKAPVVILDEPTSFMDSWAEHEWMNRFCAYNERTEGTAVIITHRFTTAMRADVIYVMDGGRVVESGTHAELVRQGGLYAQSWMTQMKAEQRQPRDAVIETP